MSTEAESRKLSDLRVVDLKSELEKRGLDKAGNKQALLERLQKALEDEGIDPETYEVDSDKKAGKRLSTSSGGQQDDSGVRDQSGEGDDEAEDLENSENADVLDINIKDTDMAKENGKGEEGDQQNDAGQNEEVSKEEDETDDSKIIEIRDENIINEMESPIHLTLEEEESFQYEEIESATEDKPESRPEECDEDAKISSNKNQDDATKEMTTDSKKTEDNKKEEGSGTAVGSSSSRSASKYKKIARTRNLWITNISKTTKATELKQALSAYGKVIGAKVVINARHPGACCYGYVTMDTIADADKCIKNLNNTELNGQVIHIEKVRADHMYALKMNLAKKTLEFNRRKEKARSRGSSPHKSHSKSKDHKEGDSKLDTKEGDKEKKDHKRDDKKTVKEDGEKTDAETGKRSEQKRKSRSHDKDKDKDKTDKSDKTDKPDKEKENESHHRSDSKSSKSKRGRVLTFDRIKVERDRQRLRERERIIREENRRRREESARQREIERMQRSEAARLDREREKLRIEREKLERDKAEIIRLERERQKIEREKLEIERLELQRAKIRLQEEDRRPLKRPPPYRREGSYEDRKRIAGAGRRYEESPPPRYEHPTSVKLHEPTPPSKKFGSPAKDYKQRIVTYKHETYSPKTDREFESERPNVQPPLTRTAPTTVTKYEESSVFNANRTPTIHNSRSHENPTSVSSSRMAKDARYNEREREQRVSDSYRPVRDERDRRAMIEHKGEIRPSRDHRYGEIPKEVQRFERNSGSNNWQHPGVSSNKAFVPGNSAVPKAWGKETWRPTDGPNNQERWNSGNVMRGPSMSTGAFPGNSNMNLGPSCPPPPAINSYSGERFEYKSMSNVRKY